MRLKEQVLRLNEQLTGNRLLRGMACLGGVRFDWNADQIKAISRLSHGLRPEFDSLVGFDPRVLVHARPAWKPPALSSPKPLATLGW